MNNYWYSDTYPDFHVTIRKRGEALKLKAVTLQDLGLPYDISAAEITLDMLNKERKEGIIAEFQFLINRLLPRDIYDFFNRIGLDKREIYKEAFDQAADLMGLERYNTFGSSGKYGQFKNHVSLGIQDFIEDGLTLTEIYENTCVTKGDIKRIANKGFPEDYVSKNRARWNAMEVEVILFGMKNVNYRYQVPLGNEVADFCIYAEECLLFAIKLISDIYYTEPANMADKLHESINHLLEYCNRKQIPLLLIDDMEIDANHYYCELPEMISKTIRNPAFCNQHNNTRRKYACSYDLWWIWDEDEFEEAEYNEEELEDIESIYKIETFSQDRKPIVRKDEEYIFVNVLFEGNDKTYCYLCDDELIQVGDEVIVPVGQSNDERTVMVKSIEIHTAECAPIPIEKCKKIICRL